MPSLEGIREGTPKREFWNFTSGNEILVPPGSTRFMVQEPSHPVAVIVHLTGPTRGQTQRLRGEELQIGTAQSADIRLVASGADLARAAVLRRHGNPYRLKAMPDVAVWLNSEQVDEMVLASGDVLEIGDRGEAFRFRIYPPDSAAYKPSSLALAAPISGCQRLRRTSCLNEGFPDGSAPSYHYPLERK